MFCNSCGHKNPDGSNFCASCGASLKADDTTVTFLPVEAEEDSGIEIDVPLDELEEDQALLVAVKGPNAGARYLIDQPITRIGRHPDSDIFLDDITVSRRHAELRTGESEEFTVKDAGSLNGTYVNRERVDEVSVSSGDEIQVGKFRFVFYTAEV